ncbi:unnamed protein product [Chrysoparadoxa australica]
MIRPTLPRQKKAVVAALFTPGQAVIRNEGGKASKRSSNTRTSAARSKSREAPANVRLRTRGGSAALGAGERALHLGGPGQHRRRMGGARVAAMGPRSAPASAGLPSSSNRVVKAAIASACAKTNLEPGSNKDKTRALTAALFGTAWDSLLEGSRQPDFMALNLKANEALGLSNAVGHGRDRVRGLQRIRRLPGSSGLKREGARHALAAAVPRAVALPPRKISVKELGMMMSRKSEDVEAALRQLGETSDLCHGDHMVDTDTAELLCIELGHEVTRLARKDWNPARTDADSEETKNSDDYRNLPARQPVVSVMGHVDHGKTTLLDALRSSSMAEKELAGITQRLAAFVVPVKGQGETAEKAAVTFFDTPGHAAFASMRASTSRLVDIVVLVIAADDGVKEQTLEVLKLLGERPGLQAVVALTKVDRPGIDVREAKDRISRELMGHGITVEDYGGEIPVVPVSGKTGKGLNELVEAVLLQAEVLELRSDPSAPGEAVVIDSSLVKGLGHVADVLVTWGTLKPGQMVMVGQEWGRVRRLLGPAGAAMKECSASVPVRIVGLKSSPAVGDEVLVVESEATAKLVAAKRQRLITIRQAEEMQEEGRKLYEDLAQQVATQVREFADQWQGRRNWRFRTGLKAMKEEAARKWSARDEGPPYPVNAIFKADGHGLLAAMEQVLEGLPRDEVYLKVVHAGVGPVTKSDIELASQAGATIYTFNVGVAGNEVTKASKMLGVSICAHGVIYRFFEDVTQHLEKHLPEEFEPQVLGKAEVLEVFATSGRGRSVVPVAGCAVTEGELKQGGCMRLMRGGEEVGTISEADSMRHFKERVTTGLVPPPPLLASQSP